eukprot:16212-Heterococcus_DN1.PRE.4
MVADWLLSWRCVHHSILRAMKATATDGVRQQQQCTSSNSCLRTSTLFSCCYKSALLTLVLEAEQRHY